METRSHDDSTKFVYRTEELAFRAAKRVSKEFELRKLASLSLKRSKEIIAGIAGYGTWKELVVCVRESSSEIDRDLNFDQLVARRTLQAERLSHLARIDVEVAKKIICSAEPTDYASGSLRWYLGHDTVELRGCKPVIAMGIDNIFPAFKETMIDDLPPISLDWLREETLPDDVDLEVTEFESGNVTVQLTYAPPDGAISAFTVTYYRHMAILLEEEEDYPLKPTKIYKLYVDYRLREAKFQGEPNYHGEMLKAAAAFIMLDVTLTAFTIVDRAKLEIPIVEFEVDIDRSKHGTVALGEAMVEVFTEFMSIEDEDDEITSVVPFDMITVDDIHTD
ncbi:hypothetical protein HFN89_05450 [Rhizobium laguerreae]|nr:hypothetical protein [Rhizobium laguerreae]